jgi:hypothetical protein
MLQSVMSFARADCLLTGRGGGLSSLGGGIWTKWMLSSIVGHDGRNGKWEMSNSRYRAGLN